MSSLLRRSPSSSPPRPTFIQFSDDEDDAETASQRSIPLSSPATPPDHRGSRNSVAGPLSPALSQTSSTMHSISKESVESETSSLAYKDEDGLSVSGSSSKADTRRSSLMSAAALSIADHKSEIKYPPAPFRVDSDTVSMASFSSTTSNKKARPESLLVVPPRGPLVLGIGLVDFNHLECRQRIFSNFDLEEQVGPKLEFTDGPIFEDEQISKILPFLALPDGAHMSSEDYSYFHLVPSSPNPTTIFGISCNRQIKAVDLLVKDVEVTRSTVQKAVVVLASKPVFGPIRDKLGVVTQALFNQRDFRETDILVDFRSSLETSLRSQLTESGLYMGTSLRELVHTFRSRTLILLKALMLQKRIMFYGHPVERLCTYQYSLISLIPGLLQNLDDCGSPPLASRAPTLSRPTSLRTSDRKSMMAYLGLPLDIFGKDAFFQPYLPLQQIDIIKESGSWLCGCTNSIVTQQKEVDLLINVETNAFEFRDPKLERSAGLTAADRKWMDEIVKDVNEGWSDDVSGRSTGIQFKGSDDYLRTKFEEYVSSALASVKYSDFLAKGQQQEVIITGGSEGSDPNAVVDFNPLWISEFRRTNAFEVWNRITDPLLFDICEARHPCAEKPNVVADIGLRLQEGIQDLKLEQQLAPTREAITRTLATGSTSFLKAVEGVRGRWAQRSASSTSFVDDASSSTSSPVEVTRSEASMSDVLKEGPPAASPVAARPLSVVAAQAATETKATLGAWGSGIGSYFSQRAARLTLPRSTSAEQSPAPSPQNASPVNSLLSQKPKLPPNSDARNLDEAITEPNNVSKVHDSDAALSARGSEESMEIGTAM